MNRSRSSNQTAPEPERSRWTPLRWVWAFVGGLGILLGVLFAVGALPSQIQDGCENWGVSFCSPKYPIEELVSIDPSHRGEWKDAPYSVLGIRDGDPVAAIDALFPPTVEVQIGEDSGDGWSHRQWIWEGVSLAADVQVTTGSVRPPLTVAVQRDSKWLVPLPDGLVLGSSSLKEAEERYQDASSEDPVVGDWIEGFNWYEFHRFVPQGEEQSAIVFASEEGAFGDYLTEVNDDVCSRVIVAYTFTFEVEDLFVDPEIKGSCIP